MLTRRRFLELGSAVAIFGGCRSLPKGGATRFGVISDTHVTGRESIDELSRTFAFLRQSMRVDAVIHCGDMTDFGYIEQLEAFAEAWRRAMPEEVPLIPVMGNRDFSDTKRMSDEKRAADRDRLLLSDPERHVRRILGVDLAGGLRACNVRGVSVVSADWKHQASLEAFMLRHPELRDPAQPLVCVQHPHPGGTIYRKDEESCSDPVTCWLNMFPRAVSLSGHSHLPFTEERTFCRREFTAAAAGSHYLGGGSQQTGRREVSVLSIDASGIILERFGLHDGSHAVLSREFPSPPPPDRAVPGSFVFAQWNVGGFCLGQDGASGAGTAARAEAFRRRISETDADFLGLCEYAPQFEMCGKPASDAAFGGYPHAATGPRLGANGNAVLSRGVPLSDARVHHFQNRSQERYFLSCEAVVAGTRTTLVETHLDLDAGNRQSQLAELLRQFGDRPNVIVSGDFNQATIDEFAPFVKAGFRLANGGCLGTFLTHRRRKTAYTPAIDNLLVKGFDILSVRTGDDSMMLSDHRMLVCRLRPLAARH